MDEFEEFWEKYFDDVTRYAQSLAYKTSRARSKDEKKDLVDALVNETYIRAKTYYWKSKPTKFRQWVCTILRNVWRQWLDEEKKARFDEFLDHHVLKPSGASQSINTVTAEYYLDRISEQDRRIVTKRYLEGKEYELVWKELRLAGYKFNNPQAIRRRCIRVCRHMSDYDFLFHKLAPVHATIVWRRDYDEEKWEIIAAVLKLSFRITINLYREAVKFLKTERGNNSNV